MDSDYIDQGKLQVIVSTQNGTVPVSDAVVRITNIVNGELITEITTNASGRSEVIELPAPPIELSVQESTAKPYASYNVTVSAKEFETLHIGGVQILPSSKAIQPANLKLLRTNEARVQNVLIEPHTLWGDYPPKIPEPEVKPLPQFSGLVVLPEPVIPEFMVVHLGVPNDASAENRWVYFADYIKNVASNEIYSTWERETIKANVLAIVSFALNRVYTEWYRGQGFDFTITNSTAYDQSFNPSRNVYEDISILVDDLFSTYITRESIVQPLLTQFCDGRRTQCNGLSQWGSQELGQQGINAINILKNYYGSNIYLATAEKVEGVPRSYGGTVLTLGSSGQDVQTIQTQLNRISDNFPAIKKTRANGEYDEATQNAVREFQKIFNLPQTGSVDFATWYAISNIYVAVAKLATL